MAEGFNAGSIFVELRTQLESLEKGAASAKRILNGMGDSAKDSSERFNKAGEHVTETFSKIDRTSLRVAARFARFSATVLSLQAAMGGLGNSAAASFGKFKVEAEAGATAAERFLYIFGLMPTKATAALGGIVALVGGFQVAKKAITEVEQKMKDLNQRIREGIRKDIADLAKRDAAFGALPGAESDIASSLQNSEQTLEAVAKATRSLAQAKAELAQNEAILTKRIDDQRKSIEEWTRIAEATARTGGNALGIQGEIQRAREELKKAEDELKRLKNAVGSSESAVKELGVTADEAAVRFRNLSDAFDLSKSVEAARQLRNVIAETAELGQRRLLIGIASPLEIAEQKAKAVRDALEAALKAQQDLLTASRIVRAQNPTLANMLEARANAMGTDIGVLKAQDQAAQSALSSQININSMAQGFSGAIGQGIREGILSGQSAMETLANVGRNLFQNSLDQVITKFQSGMTEAFKALAGTGAGGEALGGLFSGLMGIGGMLLSKRGGSAKQSFNSVQSVVNSSQAVRGIVAGPQNVAIAEVGTKLEAAMFPVREELGRILNTLKNIETNTRGGRAGAGGGGFVQVATSGGPV